MISEWRNYWPRNIESPYSGIWDMTRWRWSYKVAVEGEALSVYTFEGSSSWYKVKKPLTWYKATFDSPQGNDPLALDIHEHHGERWYEIPWSWLYPKGACWLSWKNGDRRTM
ncbi:PREDICTED: beta-galactosidase 12 [Theobroma cacao]|uniref:Beta-galactosidase 12 n=1 Tax=Theobroma cacao TaxID=3641 RepID=A0AB32WYM3_THECC|nr:PREDICTED: beta-galactosidase 12 [Theobroma cacao]